MNATLHKVDCANAQLTILAQFGTAGTVIRRQSVGFEPKFGWYRGSFAPRPDVGRAFFICSPHAQSHIIK